MPRGRIDRPGWVVAWLACVLALSLGVPGCGRKKAPVAVAGRVQFADHKPVSNQILIFHPRDDSNKAAAPPTGVVTDGRFQFTALPGRYKATLRPIPAREGGNPGGGAPLAPPSPDRGPPGKGKGKSSPFFLYEDPERSPWEIDIPEGGKEDLVLTVK